MPRRCAECGGPVYTQGPARRQRVTCRRCRTEYSYPSKDSGHPPAHRMWAMEYHCEACKPTHRGGSSKRPDADDHERYEQARLQLLRESGLPIPNDEIPPGDETDRLHRWGYRRYREMFTQRQLLGLGLLLRRIQQVSDSPVRHALLTVFSDFLRYQNMLCRYDTYALKCQDIFSVHGFPVGLVQCENNLLGIPKVGAGAFRHFVEKYLRAKQYCEAPFETRLDGKRKKVVPITGERISAEFVSRFPVTDARQAHIAAAPATEMPLSSGSLDGVFTDPPYFANVQYAELIDFNYVWLRQALRDEFPQFGPSTTRSPDELTGNVTLGRGIEHFTEGLSAVFRHYAASTKARCPLRLYVPPQRSGLLRRRSRCHPGCRAGLRCHIASSSGDGCFTPHPGNSIVSPRLRLCMPSIRHCESGRSRYPQIVGAGRRANGACRGQGESGRHSVLGVGSHSAGSYQRAPRWVGQRG